jgi:hypothetical protein
MSEMIEAWSLPWHALLRSLASEFDGATSGAASKLDSAGGTRAEARPASWLVRARRAAPLTYQANR